MRTILLQAALLIFPLFTLADGNREEGFPTQLGSYKDPRSSKEHLICSDFTRKYRFENADTVFFGVFKTRMRDLEKKVFIDTYEVKKSWKGAAKEGNEFKIEVPPPSDFCSGSAPDKTIAYIIYAKGEPPFLDCCMREVDYPALVDKARMKALDSEMRQLKGASKR